MSIMVLELARNCNKFKKLRKSKLSGKDLSIIEHINSVSQLGLSQVIKPNIDIIQIANVISNLEPTISLSNGNILSLQKIRARLTYQTAEIEFVQDKIYDLVKPFQLGTEFQVYEAVKHLLIGNQLTYDVGVYKDILGAFNIAVNPIQFISTLIGFAIGFELNSVNELADRVSSHYVDRFKEANLTKQVHYLVDGAIKESLVW